MNEFLAKIFEAFKAKSPKLAAAIILILGSIVYWAQNGLSELIGYDLSIYVKYIAIALGFLQGAHTTDILKPPAIKK